MAISYSAIKLKVWEILKSLFDIGLRKRNPLMIDMDQLIGIRSAEFSTHFNFFRYIMPYSFLVEIAQLLPRALHKHG